MLDNRGDFLYPFTAIVGQEAMKNALVLNAINPHIGGLLIRGSSGTAKSTAVRGLAALLPNVNVVADCPFSCDPREASAQCSVCRERSARGETLPSLSRPRRLVNLPLNATEDRVAGTLDITRALCEGVRALEPGLLAEANRGILYIDEINLLDDHIVDILLDAAALGVNIVEREGVSVSHPARFLLIGTMNPEEGELRPQIADRIGLQVEVEALAQEEQRVEVMKRREAFLADPAAFVAAYCDQEEELAQTIARATGALPFVVVPERLYLAVARLTARSQVHSHRADITIIQCAKAMAALEGRRSVEPSDILAAATLALGHRLPYDPFVAERQLDTYTLRRQLEDILEETIEVKKKAAEDGGQIVDVAIALAQPPAVGEGAADAAAVFGSARRRAFFVRSAAGHRDDPVASLRRGKYTRPRLPRGPASDVALDATLRAAAARQMRGHTQPLAVKPEDMREKARRHPAHYVIAFVLDNSWSIHVETTIEKTKGVVFDLLRDARIHRDKVALIAFRHSRRPDATVCLPPTASYALAAERLRRVPISGSTPLADGIRRAYYVLRQERAKYHNAVPVMVIVTDGLPNVPLQAGRDPYQEVAQLCKRLAWAGIATVVVDTESAGAASGPGNCREMATLSRGKYLTLSGLTESALKKALAD